MLNRYYTAWFGCERRFVPINNQALTGCFSLYNIIQTAVSGHHVKDGVSNVKGSCLICLGKVSKVLVNHKGEGNPVYRKSRD